MSFAGRLRLYKPPIRHIQRLVNVNSTHRLGFGFRQSQPFAIHRRNLTTSFPSRSADSPTRIFIPNPYSDNIPGEPMPEHVRHLLAEEKKEPQCPALDREVALKIVPLSFLLANFPEEDGFKYLDLGLLPRDIEYVDEKAAPTTIPRDETRLYLAGRRGDGNARIEGRKQGGVVCFVLCALPPGGFGVPEPPRPATPFVAGGGTAETPGLNAAEKALLELVREIQDVGYQGAPPMGEAVEGCMVVVFLGEHMLFYDYSRERGFFDPPGGHEFVGKKVDGSRLFGPPLPSSSQFEQK